MTAELARNRDGGQAKGADDEAEESTEQDADPVALREELRSGVFRVQDLGYRLFMASGFG